MGAAPMKYAPVLVQDDTFTGSFYHTRHEVYTTDDEEDADSDYLQLPCSQVRTGRVRSG
jgi:hypothetical protein